MNDKLLVLTALSVVVALCWVVRYVFTKRAPQTEGLAVLAPSLALWLWLPEGSLLGIVAAVIGVGVVLTTYGFRGTLAELGIER